MIKQAEITSGIGMCEKCYPVNGVACTLREATIIPYLKWVLQAAGRDISSEGILMGELDERIEECPVNSKGVAPTKYWPDNGGGALIVNRKLVTVDGEELVEIALKRALRSTANKRS